MKILVTGAQGYLGVPLCAALSARGYEVIGMDAGFFNEGWLDDGRPYPQPPCLRRDIRDVSAEDLRGVDAVLHLAELSNDPLGELRADVTYAINHRGTVHLANAAKRAGVARFLYSSSCSVYGFRPSDEYLTEESEPAPQTTYAECKVRVEREVSALADDSFSPTFLRNATAYGPAPRMRFDLVLNNLAALAWTSGEIRMISDGSPYRPLVHLQDIAGAFISVLEAPREAVHNQIFNVGATGENYRIRELAEIVREVFPGCRVRLGDDADQRSYRVSFEKIHALVPGFRCVHDAAAGARQLREFFERAAVTRATFESRSYTRVKQLRHLLDTEQIGPDFFWTTGPAAALR